MKRRGNFDILSRFRYYCPGVADLFILLAWLIGGALLGNLFSLGFLALYHGEGAAQYATMIAYPLMFIPAMIYASVKSRKNFLFGDTQVCEIDRNGFEGKAFISFFIVIFATVGINFVSEIFTNILPEVPQWLKETLKSMTSGNFFLNFIVTAVFAAFFEEWLCRGMVLRGLLGNGFKPLWAIVISSAFFAVIHLNPWQAIPAFLMGMFFGFVYYKTGSLKISMFMHFVNNGSVVILSHLYPDLAEISSWKEVLEPAQYKLFFACFCLIIALSLLFFSRFGKKADIPA